MDKGIGYIVLTATKLHDREVCYHKGNPTRERYCVVTDIETVHIQIKYRTVYDLYSALKKIGETKDARRITDGFIDSKLKGWNIYFAEAVVSHRHYNGLTKMLKDKLLDKFEDNLFSSESEVGEFDFKYVRGCKVDVSHFKSDIKPRRGRKKVVVAS